MTSKFKVGDKVVPNDDEYRDRKDWGTVIEIRKSPSDHNWYKVGNPKGGSSFPWMDDELALESPRPTTADIRHYATAYGTDDPISRNHPALKAAEARFDRWLLGHDRELAAQTLREAADEISSYAWQPGDTPKRSLSLEESGAYMWGAIDAHDIVDRLLLERADQLEKETK